MTEVDVPYEIKRKGSKYQVVNKETGEVKAEATSKSKAERQLRLLRGIEHGWTPSGGDKYTRTVNGKKVTLHLVGGKGRGTK